MNTGFWNKRSVFLTGHTGFKGTWLSLWLQRLGANLTGYALAPQTEPSMFDVVNAAAGMKHVVGEIRDLDTLSGALGKARPEVVIHMAAQPLVRHSYDQPVATFETNVMGTVNVLEACRRCPSVRCVVVVTTDKCYENHEWPWGYREIESMGGHDPYSASKASAEIVTAAYRRSFFASGPGMHPALVATVRAGNVIGGGDWALDRLIPDIVRAFCRDEEVVIRSPDAVRPWQHVLEPLSAYLLLAEKLHEGHEQYADAWNIGPLDSGAKAVRWIVERMTACWGEGARWRLDDQSRPHEATSLKLDISKAIEQLGWKPALTLDRAIDLLIAWYRAYHDGSAAMRDLTIRQIEGYMAAREPNALNHMLPRVGTGEIY